MPSKPAPSVPEPDRPSSVSPAVPWWVIVALIAIAVGAYVVLVVIGGQDSASTAGSLGGLLTAVLAVLGVGRRA